MNDQYTTTIATGSNTIGSVTTAPLSYTTSTSTAVTTASSQVVAAGQFSRVVQFQTLPASTVNIWLNPTGGASVPNSGVCVPAGGGSANFGTPALPMSTTAITACTDAGAAAQTLLIVGG